MMRFLRRALTGVFLLALSLALLGQSGRLIWNAVSERMAAEPRGFARTEPPRLVETLTLRTGPQVPVMTAFGEVRATRRLALRAPVGGILRRGAEALVEGGRVRAGQMLFEIDPAEARAARDRAAADLAQARADERNAARGLTLARDELAAAAAQAALRETALDRQRDLRGRGIATAADLEAAELAASAAAAAMLSAREAVSAAEARIDQTAIASDRARIARDEAERVLGSTLMRAPFDGVLAEVTARQGARVTANEAVAELIDPERIEIALRLSTAQYARLAAGRDGPVGAPLRVLPGPERGAEPVAGRITRESATVGEGQTGRLLFAEIGPAPALRPGDFVTVEIEEPPLAGVARLPATALGSDGAVLVLAGGRLSARPVELLRRQGDTVLVRGEALDGAEVVRVRSPLLGDGLAARSAAARDRPERPAPEETPARPLAGTDPEPEAGPAPAEETMTLDTERRDRLRAYLLETDELPAPRRAALLEQIEAERVPAALVLRLEQRIGG